MDPHRHDAILPAPFGALGIRLSDGHLVGIDFLPPGIPFRAGISPLARQVVDELAAYLETPTHVFQLALEPGGTSFRRRVWAEIQAIPPGEVRSYGQLAKNLNSGPRAVGQAVGDNPLPILIPCHRVVAASGLGGFMHGRAGFPLEVKRWLLRHEGALGN